MTQGKTNRDKKKSKEKRRYISWQEAVGIVLKCLVILIFIWPVFWIISTSLQTMTETNSIPPTFFPKIPQFVNYQNAWNNVSNQGGSMMLYTKNSLIVVVVSIVLQLLIAIPAAYAFAKYEFRGKNLLFGLVLIALMMPTAATFIPIYLMMSRWNLINSLWPQILPTAVDAFAIFLLRQYFMQIDDELLDAAKLDGAGNGRIIWHVMLPLSKPAMASIALFSFIGKWNDYFWPLIMTNNDRYRTLPIAIAQLKEMEGLTNWNTIMAGNVILLAPILIVYIFMSRQIMEFFAYKGIK